MRPIVIGFEAKPSVFSLLRWRLAGHDRLFCLGPVPKHAARLGFRVERFAGSVGDFRVEGRNLTWPVDGWIRGYTEQFVAGCDGAALKPLYPECLGEADILAWLRRYLNLKLHMEAPYWEAWGCMQHSVRHPHSFHRHPREGGYPAGQAPNGGDVAPGPRLRGDDEREGGDDDREGICFENNPVPADYLGQKTSLWPHVAAALLILPKLALRFLVRPLPKGERRRFTLALPLFRGVEPGQGITDVFWQEGAGVPNRDVLFYTDFDGDNNKLGRQAADLGYGYAGTILTDLPVRERLAVALDLLSFPVRAWMRIGNPLRDARRFALWEAAIEYKRFYTLWFRFFETHGIRFHLHHGDTNLSLQPYIDALEKGLNGLDVSYEFSASGWIPPQLARPVRQTQFLARGSWTDRSMHEAGVHSHLQDWRASFLVGVHKQMLRDRPVSAALLEGISRARRAGKKLIGVFDISCAPSRLLPVAGRLRFYDLMLEVIAENPGSVFLFKPQRDLHPGEEVASRYRQLEAEGRCIFARAGIDETPLQPLFRLIDFAIGLGGFNSALIEAASEEVPHVFYDEWDSTPENFRGLIPPELLAEEEGKFRALVRHVDQGAFDVASVAGWRAYLNLIDPFRDAKGHIRIGEVLKFWVEEFAMEGKSREAMLASVIGRYRAKYGHDSVMENSGDVVAVTRKVAQATPERPLA